MHEVWFWCHTIIPAPVLKLKWCLGGNFHLVNHTTFGGVLGGKKTSCDIWKALKNRRVTVANSHFEPKVMDSNGGLVQMIFLFNWVICKFHVNFPGCRAYLMIFHGALMHFRCSFLRLLKSCDVKWHANSGIDAAIRFPESQLWWVSRWRLPLPSSVAICFRGHDQPRRMGFFTHLRLAVRIFSLGMVTFLWRAGRSRSREGLIVRQWLVRLVSYSSCHNHGSLENGSISKMCFLD